MQRQGALILLPEQIQKVLVIKEEAELKVQVVGSFGRALVKAHN